LQPAASLFQALTNSPSVTSLIASLPSTPNTNALTLFATAFSTNSVLIYPAWASNFVIEFSPSLEPNSWTQLNAPVDLLDSYLVLGLPQTPSNLFFRLRR
jgi:hypothetical protein